MQVIWGQPFTMEDFPITGYNVTVVDFIDQNSQDVESSLQLSPDTLSFTLTHTDPSMCTNLTFFVVAVNDIGGSSPGVVNGAFPSCKYWHA